jgi:hypothetical protein
MRGLLHGPLVSNRSAWPARNPREVLRDGPTKVLLDGRRASEYALIAAASTPRGTNQSIAGALLAPSPSGSRIAVASS